jgi:predicted secreted protein
MQMVDGIHRHLLSQTAQQVAERPRLWKRDFSSAANYEQSVAANRQRFRRIIGAVDERAAATGSRARGGVRIADRNCPEFPLHNLRDPLASV